MNAYRAVIAGTVALTIVSAVMFAILNDKGVTDLAGLELVALVILDILATVYVGWLSYRDRRRPRSWLLLFLVTGKILITGGLIPISFVIIRRLFGLPPLDPGVGLRLVAIGLIAIAYVPVMTAALFFLVQRDPSAVVGDDAIVPEIVE